MAFVYVVTLIFVFAVSIAPALQFLFDIVFAFAGVPGGYKTIVVDGFIVLGVSWVVINSPTARVLRQFLHITKWWAPWILYLLIQSGMSDTGLWKFEMYLARIVIPCMAVALLFLSRPEKFEKYFFGTLIGVVLILIPATYVADFAEKDFYRNIWLSRVIAICALYLFINMGARLDVTVKGGVLLFFVVTMFLIGSRGPFLSFLLSAGLFFFLKNRRNYITLFTGALSVALVAVLFLEYAVFSGVAAEFLSHGKAEEFSDIENDRVGVYEPTILMALKEPLTGHGLGRWWIEYSEMYGLHNDGDYKYPHNILLEILSELGIIGLGLFLLLFRPLKRIFTLDNPYNIFVLVGFLFAATSSDITQNAAPLIFNLMSHIYYERMKQNGKSHRA